MHRRKHRFRHLFITVMSLCVSFSSGAQVVHGDSVATPAEQRVSHRRLKTIVPALTAGYAAGMTGLYLAWYKDYPSGPFHFFNDNREWLQVDKVGHTGSVYYLSRWSSGIFRWSGLDTEKSAMFGAGTAFLFLATVEVFDGFSAEWGFSAGDMAANTLGAGVFLAQELAWKEQRLSFKFSWQEDPLVKSRPGTFGSSLPEKVLKDYNGQTYWLSANLRAFLPRTRVPAWLNLALGYGAGGMLTAETSGITTEGKRDAGNRYRQFYLSPDIDWPRIPTRSKALKTIFKCINVIKIPAPALEFRNNGNWKLHGLYF